MRNIELFETFGERTIILKSRQHRTITISIINGKLGDIVNESGVRFPYHKGESYNRGISTWCCNNGFTMDGKDMCPEEKVFGMKKKDIPLGHDLRKILPNKFR